MFHHVKELEYNARVSGPDPRFASMLLEQFTREIAHFKMFEAALDSIQPNFPPGILQGDPRYTHTFVNLSDGASARGPWNGEQGPWDEGEHWNYIENPYQHVIATKGMTEHPIQGTNRTQEESQSMSRHLGQKRSQEIKAAIGNGPNQWSSYPHGDIISQPHVER